MKNIRRWSLVSLLPLLAACGGGGSDCSFLGSALCNDTQPANLAPVAQAAGSQSVLLGVPVTLDGSSSTDPNRDTLTYKWAWVSKPVGSLATLSDSNSAKPMFTPDSKGTYVLSLVVSDGQLFSAPASVVVLASELNAAPVAHAGTNQNVVVGATVTLDGRDSSDANRGDVLTFNWLLSRPDGSTLALSGVRPTFTASTEGAYLASLTVSDGALASDPVVVRVQASLANAPPVASAGSAQSVVTGSVVTLDGSASSDANRDALSYKWAAVFVPPGSSATLSSAVSAKPTFTADVAGVYVFGLVVNDGAVDSAVSSVAVTASVANAAPVARAGVDQSVSTGSVVTLDGSASSDANRDGLFYKWSTVYVPPGSSATLSSLSNAKPTFTADVAGVYVFGLVVNDGSVDSALSSVAVTVAAANTPPVANAGLAQTVAVGDVVSLDGSASTDADGDALTYSWALSNVPVGSTATLTGATTVSPTFTADVAGMFVATLTVSDGRGGSHVSTVPILAE